MRAADTWQQPGICDHNPLTYIFRGNHAVRDSIEWLGIRIQILRQRQPRRKPSLSVRDGTAEIRILISEMSAVAGISMANGDENSKFKDEPFRLSCFFAYSKQWRLRWHSCCAQLKWTIFFGTELGVSAKHVCAHCMLFSYMFADFLLCECGSSLLGLFPIRFFAPSSAFFFFIRFFFPQMFVHSWCHTLQTVTQFSVHKHD